MNTRTWRLLEAAAVLLFALQAIRVIFAMLFAAVYDAMFDGEGLRALLISLGLMVAMLAMPALAPRRAEAAPMALRVAAVLTALVRTLLSVDIPLVRMAAASLTLGLVGIYVASLLSAQASALAPALGLALAADQLLRALGHTYDPSLWPWWGAVQLGLTLGVIVLAEWRLRWEEPPAEARVGGWPAGLALGAALFLFSSLLALPNAAARWTGASYALMTGALLAAALLSLSPWAARLQAALGGAPRWARLIVALGLMGGLALAYLVRGIPAALGLIVAALALYLLLPTSLASGRNGVRRGVGLGLLVLVLLSALHALAFTYAYTLDLFRGMGLPAFLLGAAIAAAPGLLWPAPPLPQPTHPRGRAWLGLAGGAAVWLAATLWAIGPRPALKPTVDTIRIATYNIHYGFNTHWNLSLEAQARAIALSQADVVVLQEVDAGRLTSFGIDNAEWLARRLRMQAVYLPTVEHTTGIALLTRLKLAENGGLLLPSRAEPTG
ncbi:MAG: hypothetical protein V1772_05470, partial [Chloroflexota bacterium]